MVDCNYDTRGNTSSVRWEVSTTAVNGYDYYSYDSTLHRNDGAIYYYYSPHAVQPNRCLVGELAGDIIRKVNLLMPIKIARQSDAIYKGQKVCRCTATFSEELVEMIQRGVATTNELMDELSSMFLNQFSPEDIQAIAIYGIQDVQFEKLPVGGKYLVTITFKKNVWEDREYDNIFDVKI